MNISAIKDKLTGGSQRTAIVKKNILGLLAIKSISILTSLLLVPMQPGDVPVTYADTTPLERDFGFKPHT